jgi:type I restriction enzyme, S subunit
MVAKGYKQTDIGIIPKEWEVKTYGEVFDFLTTATYSRADLNESGEVNYIHYGDIHTKWNFFLDFNENVLPKIENEQVKNYPFLKDGDIIMADASEDYNGICASVEVKNIRDKKAISGLHTFLLRDNKKVFAEGFKGYLHSNSVIKKQFDKLATGLKVYGVSKNNLKIVQIPIPPLPEQQAIAQALSNTDTLITNLQNLIAKKRLIKQAAMQELLTPKKGWESKKLGEVCKLIMGQSPLSEYYNNERIGLPLVQGNADIENRKTIIRNYTSVITKKANLGSIIMSVRAPVGEIAIATFECCIGRGVCSIEYKNNFIYHYLIFIENNWAKHSTGSTFDSITSQQVRDLEISFPNEKEQTRIANILTDMDNEITTLEQKLEKYKSIKQGMMQDLLTGKIRVV